MKLTLAAFQGRVPRLGDRHLGDTQATVANNCKLTSGELRSFRNIKEVNDPAYSTAGLLTIYLYGKGETYERWLQWGDDVDVTKGPIAGDTTERTYFTGTDKPRAFDKDMVDIGGDDEYPESTYILGVPAPTTAPTATVTGTPSGDPVDRAYVYTFLTGWGEEGPPSPPSSTVTVETGESVDLTTMDQAPAGDYNISKWRIYRVVTSITGAEYQFVAEVTINTNTPQYNDSKTDAQLGEVLPTLDWDPPPTTMVGLIALPNGVLAGFTGNEICLSEPYVPHAWPISYRRIVNYPIIGLGHFGNTIVILTEEHPYLLTGLHPSALSMSTVSSPFPCVSKRGIVSTDLGVMYPSNDGLILINPSGTKNMTAPLMDRDDWSAYQPASLHACFSEGKYFGFYSRGIVDGLEDGNGFIFEVGKEIIDIESYYYACHVEPEEDKLYLVTWDGTDNLIYQWEGEGTLKSYNWKSKLFLARREPWVAARVDGGYDAFLETKEEQDAYNAERDAQIAINAALMTDVYSLTGSLGSAYIGRHELAGNELIDVLPSIDDILVGTTFNLYGDGELIFSKVVYDNKPFRLPGSKVGQERPLELQIELIGTVDIRKVDIATSLVELVNP